MIIRVVYPLKNLFFSPSACEKGRSMVEMLGVLAIIGVLSVGAMAGYTRALYKHKLNQQISLYNQIIYFIHENHEKFYNLSNGTPLQPYLYKFGVIPVELMYYDYFNNRYFMRKRTNFYDMSIMLSSQREEGYFTSGSNFTICKDIFSHLIIANSASIYSVGVLYGIGGTDDPTEWKNQYFGDTVCNRQSKKCFSELTMAQISADCDACKAQRACRIHFTFRF